MHSFVLLLWLLLVFWLLLIPYLACLDRNYYIPSSAHAGYLHLVRTSLMCSISVLRCSVVEETVLALRFSVFIMLFLAPMWW